jgi:flagellar biosynthesis protein FlhB
MSTNKSEKPTLKKQRDARLKGHVAYSSDASSAAVFCVGFVVLICLFNSFVFKWKEMLVSVWAGDFLYRPAAYKELFYSAISFIIRVSLIVMIPALFAGFIAGYLQIGPLFRTVKIDPEKINPFHGIKHIFTRKSVTELLKTVCKFTLYASIIVCLIWTRLIPIAAAPLFDLETLLAILGQLTITLLIYTIVVAALFGTIDYFLQKHIWLNELKMTRDEVKREYKESEGDPVMKGLRKQHYQEIIQSGISDRISRSRIVVVNPTRYAVAVEYKDGWQGPPRVTAKGYLKSAARIRKLAREHQIPVIRHPPLARLLFTLGIDQEIPEELFRAIAELIVYISGLSDIDRLKCR